MFRMIKISFVFLILQIAACLLGGESEVRHRAGNRSYAFINASLIPLDGTALQTRQTLLVEKETIVAVGPMSDIKPREGDTIVDLKGAFVMPGLVDMHTHILDDQDLFSYLDAGVTTVFSLGSPDETLQLRQSVSEGLVFGPQIIAARMVNAEPGKWKVVLTDIEQVAEFVDQTKKQGWDAVKVYSHLNPEVFAALVVRCREAGITLVGHGVRELGFQGSMDGGLTMLAHAEEILYTAFQGEKDPESLFPEIAATFKRNHAYLTPTLVTFEAIQQQWGSQRGLENLLKRDSYRKVRPGKKQLWLWTSPYVEREGDLSSMLRLQEKLVLYLHRQDVPLLTGTDSPTLSIAPGYGVHEEITRLHRLGMSREEAIQAATTAAHQYFQEHMVNLRPAGKIAAGSRADFLILDHNPLSDLRNLQTFHAMVVGGRYLDKETLNTKRKSHAQRMKGQKIVLETAIRKGAQAAEKEVQSQSTVAGMPALVDLAAFNELAYRYLYIRKEPEEALALFQLNQRAHPDSWITNSSLGDGYAALDRKEEAAEAYRKALNLNPNHQPTREALEQLGPLPTIPHRR